MKKKITAVLISVILLLTVIQPFLSAFASSSAWTGGTAVPSLSGGYYLIDTAEKLAWFANQINTGSSTLKCKLTDDIILNSSLYSNPRAWTPIGSEAHPFKGEFNGDGHYISGLYISDSIDYAGLFGYVYSEKPNIDDDDDSSTEVEQLEPPVMIHDVIVKNSSINCSGNSGGICGYIHYGQIKGCEFNGTVTSTGNSVGGICGYAYNFSRVVQCSSSGNITGVMRTGGIIGYAFSNVQVNECFSKAVVKSNASVNGNSGGIAGTASSSTIKGVYFLGSVSGPKRIGGITGYNSYTKITASYVKGAVSSTIEKPEFVNAVVGYSLGGIFVNCYYCKIYTGTGDANAVARTDEEMKKFSFVRELNENSNCFTFDYTNINNGYPVLAFSLQMYVWAGGVEEPTKDTSGYYQIKTPENLAWFAKLVNGTLYGVERNSAAKAKVLNNILLNIYITDDSSITNMWTPIGTSSYPFTGSFIGNGYNIAGVYTNGYTNQGLFGYIGTSGTVSGVVMLDGIIKGTENVGGVAGYNCGTVSMSCNDGEVNGKKSVGGIVGYNAGTVQTSYNVGTVRCTYEGGSQIGGIAGYNSRAVIKQSFNNGLVTGVPNSNYYGGICGFNSGDGLNSCYNAGEVLGGFYVGGLIGYNSSGVVKYCYNRGVVNTLNSVNSNVNNFTGLNSGSCTITNCCIDTTIENSVINNLNGATGMITENMTGSNAIYNMGISSGYFSYKYADPNDYFLYYPYISTMYYSSYTKMYNDMMESIKIVKKEYYLKVKIDGEQDTYYPDFDTALENIGENKATIIPVRNIVLDKTAEISSDIIIKGENYQKSIIRADTFTGCLFSVTGSLTLGDYKDGSDEKPLIIIDCNSSVASSSSAVVLNEQATMKTYKGFVIKNNNTSSRGGCIYMSSDSVLDMYGGIISDNTASSLEGGAIFNDMGTLNMYGGQIINNTSTVAKAGGIYNNSGVVNIAGGTVKGNYGKTFGGGIYSAGTDSQVIISDKAVITENSSNVGGGIFAVSGQVIMSGGEISNNFAYKKNGSTANTGAGGGIALSTLAHFDMSGGVIKNNYVYDNVGFGFGITAFGTMSISGSALITDNDVLLAKNRTIEVIGELTSSGICATITPPAYTTSTYVLSGSAMGNYYTKFEITPSGDTQWNVNSSGLLMNTEIVNVASLSKFGAYSVDYVSVAQAVKAVNAGESGIITIIGDNTINETIKVYGDVTILSETDQIFTSRRNGGFTDALFEVQSGGSLTFGYTDIETDDSGDITDDSVGGEYILDGGYLYNQATGTSMITVKSGGKLYTYDDFTMQNANSTVSGNIVVNGSMYMYGGTFRNNNAVNGGVLNISTAGKAYLYGGTITGNTVNPGGNGSAVYDAGTLTRAENIYEYYQNDEVVATTNTYVNITEDNDVYISTGRKLNIGSITSNVLLSETATPPESYLVSPNKIRISVPVYSIGLSVLSGDDIAAHCSEFTVTEPGYYVTGLGTLDINKLVVSDGSGLKINREKGIITGINPTRYASYYTDKFLNKNTIEYRDKDGNVLSDLSKLTTGCTINLYNETNTEISDTLTVVVFGDVNCDGLINGEDSVFISCIAENVQGISSLADCQFYAADVDASGDITQADSQYVAACGLLLNSVDQSI